MSLSATDFTLGPDHALVRVRRIALGLGVIGAGACLAGAVATPTQFFRSYLYAWVFWVGVPLGCLAILMINYLTGGAWGAAIRRVLESGTRTLPLMALLFLPVALGVGSLYEWAQPEHVAHDPLLQHKRVYLNVPFFLVRTALYFTAWIVVARLLNRWSLAQDETNDGWPARWLEQLSRGGLLLLGLTMTFAAVDWAMSLEPHWFSTIYGILFMGGCVVSAFAVAISVTAVLATTGPVGDVVRAAQFHDLGKLLLAFVMLWAYFTVSQFLITWSANLPEEIPWYLRRLEGGWQFVALAIVLFHFALPFVVLLSRDVKRNARRLAVVALLLLAMRMVDVFWLITPAFDRSALRGHPLDLAALVGVGGLWVATFLWQLGTRPLVPLRDPALLEWDA